MTDELEDRRLVKRLLAHDREAFNAFFDGYFPRLYRFARIRLGDDADTTKEIVQVTLTKAIRKLASYRGEAALFTWLCTICRNEIADHRARVARDRRHVVLTEDTPDIRAAVEAVAAPESDDPESNFRRLETTRLIQVALDQLPTSYGNALEWKYVYGYSVEEIAAKLGVGLEAAQSLLARAKRAFQEVYATLTTDLVSDATSDGRSAAEPT
ncbi:MAG TPA: sigma-70 family RNA polymerase sigma factor [Gammaproteobacteria bacterium]|nr:sigma-70 family RNA polymerase sigma factor [Gammaproteobacteria bacterium]